MSKLIVISSESSDRIIETLRAVLNNEQGFTQVVQDGSDNVPEPAAAPDVDPFSPDVDPYEHEYEDVHEIVQKRTVDFVYEGYEGSMPQWVDCEGINPDQIDEYREAFPEEEYRVVQVTDEIYTEFDEPVEYLTAEDEIDALKDRILELEAQLANERGL